MTKPPITQVDRTRALIAVERYQRVTEELRRLASEMLELSEHVGPARADRLTRAIAVLAEDREVSVTTAETPATQPLEPLPVGHREPPAQQPMEPPPVGHREPPAQQTAEAVQPGLPPAQQTAEAVQPGLPPAQVRPAASGNDNITERADIKVELKRSDFDTDAKAKAAFQKVWQDCLTGSGLFSGGHDVRRLTLSEGKWPAIALGHQSVNGTCQLFGSGKDKTRDSRRNGHHLVYCACQPGVQ